jgi:hypothetical protein
MSASRQQEQKIASEVVAQPESNQQPIWHVIILHVFTMFAYSLVWFYKNCSQLSALAQKVESGEATIEDHQTRVALKTLTRIHPALFTFGLLIPAVQFVLPTIFFRTVARLYPVEQSLVKRYSWLVAIALTALMVGLLCLSKLPDAKLPEAFYLLYLTAALPLAAAQFLLNAFWRSIEPQDRMLRQAFTGLELAMLILGSVWLGLVVTHLFTL